MDGAEAEDVGISRGRGTVAMYHADCRRPSLASMVGQWMQELAPTSRVDHEEWSGVSDIHSLTRQHDPYIIRYFHTQSESCV